MLLLFAAAALVVAGVIAHDCVFGATMATAVPAFMLLDFGKLRSLFRGKHCLDLGIHGITVSLELLSVGLHCFLIGLCYALLLGGTYALTRDGVIESTSNKIQTLFDHGAESAAVEEQDEPPEIISFTIEGVGTFQAEQGMTWGDWIMSYQVSPRDNSIVWADEQTLELYVDIGNGLWVNYIIGQHYGDTLVDGRTYYVGGVI